MPTKPMTPDELEFLIKFGSRLDKALKRRNINENQLARKMGVSRQRINQIIIGCPKSPIGIILFNKICQELEINANYLIDNVSQRTKNKRRMNNGS